MILKVLRAKHQLTYDRKKNSHESDCQPKLLYPAILSFIIDGKLNGSKQIQAKKNG